VKVGVYPTHWIDWVQLQVKAHLLRTIERVVAY
jgi:hypothetical protein